MASGNAPEVDPRAIDNWAVCDPCKRADHLGCVMAETVEECCCHG